MRVIRSLLLAALVQVAAQATFADGFAVAPQYDTAHVYVAPGDFERFVGSLIATFGGTTSRQGVFQVTPTPSQTKSQLVMTPVGTVSAFGFLTPVPAPFGTERSGYLVTDLDAAVKAARGFGAEVIVETFPDPIGRDVVISWPGDVRMQLYWHTVPPNYGPLTTLPENRVYVSPDRADAFLHDFLLFARGKVISDKSNAPGVEIGMPGVSYRRVRAVSTFGKLAVLVTDGHLPYPYGHETTGYEVADLNATLAKATAAGATILVPPFTSDDRTAAMVEFPGGYIAEIYAAAK